MFFVPCCMENENPIIDAVLAANKRVIGPDLARYRNHVYRVFQNCLLLDPDAANADKYAIAAVFHDIGIWTDHTFDYLGPSIVQARNYLVATSQQDRTAEISLMIGWHHKISRYEGDFQETVETFRKADWMDVSKGLVTFGASRAEARKIRNALPNLGFHFFLLRQTGKNFLRHPLNPIPMFRR
jgi:hypothetical protein